MGSSFQQSWRKTFIIMEPSHCNCEKLDLWYRNDINWKLYKLYTLLWGLVMSNWWWWISLWKMKLNAILVTCYRPQQISPEFIVFFLLTLYLYQMTSERIFEDQLKVKPSINISFLMRIYNFVYKNKYYIVLYFFKSPLLLLRKRNRN